MVAENCCRLSNQLLRLLQITCAATRQCAQLQLHGSAQDTIIQLQTCFAEERQSGRSCTLVCFRCCGFPPMGLFAFVLRKGQLCAEESWYPRFQLPLVQMTRPLAHGPVQAQLCEGSAELQGPVWLSGRIHPILVGGGGAVGWTSESGTPVRFRAAAAFGVPPMRRTAEPGLTLERPRTPESLGG